MGEGQVKVSRVVGALQDQGLLTFELGAVTVQAAIAMVCVAPPVSTSLEQAGLEGFFWSANHQSWVNFDWFLT